jgi:hypothetical protein
LVDWLIDWLMRKNSLIEEFVFRILERLEFWKRQMKEKWVFYFCLKMSKGTVELLQFSKELYWWWFCCVFRQILDWVQCVGWLLNRLHKEITVRSQIFGRLELLVCVFLIFELFVFILFMKHLNDVIIV